MVIKMKNLKFIIYILISIILGLTFGRVFFKDYQDNSLTAFKEGEKLYFVQIGVYDSVDTIKEVYEDYDKYLVQEENNNYHVYVGISTSKNIANRIKDYYKTLGNNIYIKKNNINNYDFLSILKEYEKIINITSNNEDLIDIERIIISNYKETVGKDES